MIMEMKTVYGKGIGKAVAGIAAEVRDFRMAPDTLRKVVLARHADEIAEGKAGYGKRFGDVGYDARWDGPYGLTRAATKAVKREVLEQATHEYLGCTPKRSWDRSDRDPLMRISSDIRRFGLEKVLSEEASMAVYSMLMRRLETVSVDVEACIKVGGYYDGATGPHWKTYSPHREEIVTALELLHLAKARGWAAEKLEAREKLAEFKRMERSWREIGKACGEFQEIRTRVMGLQLGSGLFRSVMIGPAKMEVEMAGK
jgi:hypothetical protein